MSEKSLDRKGRWRSKTVAFRLSPEENETLNNMVKLSGLTKQDYIMNHTDTWTALGELDALAMEAEEIKQKYGKK